MFHSGVETLRPTQPLILIDGNDKYHKGANAEIDSALGKKRPLELLDIFDIQTFQRGGLIKATF